MTEIIISKLYRRDLRRFLYKISNLPSNWNLKKVSLFLTKGFHYDYLLYVDRKNNTIIISKRYTDIDGNYQYIKETDIEKLLSEVARTSNTDIKIIIHPLIETIPNRRNKN